MPFSPTKTSEMFNTIQSRCPFIKLHPTSEDSDEFEIIPMDELVAPSLYTVEDADVTCMNDDEEEQQPSYESAEE